MNTAPSHSATARSVPFTSRLQLACVAASPAAVRAAIDAGADWVRIPYRAAQSCSPALKNDRSRQSIRYAHGRGRKLALDLHTAGRGLSWQDCRNAVAWSAEQGFDAIALSDFTLGLYCAARFPVLPLHFVARPGVCARTAMLLRVQMNAARVLVPDTLSVAQLVEIATKADIEVEVVASGCTRVADVGLQAHDSFSPERASGDASCNDACYSSGRHLAVSMQQLPLLASLGIRAIQVEPRNDIPDEVANVARVWRTAIDRCLKDGDYYAADPDWERLLGPRRKL